jgi:hypothetical protein
MSENSIMTLADFSISEMTAETAAAIEIHNNIVSAMKDAALALVALCDNLKRMRDNEQYKSLGFEKFEDYTEQACRIKKRQAYNYIQTYERLGGSFLQSNAQLGITKLQLLTEVCSVDRADFVEQNDLEGMSVSEIKELISKSKGFSEQISMFESENAEQSEAIKRLEEENKALRGRPVEVAVQEPTQEQLDAALAEKTKELEKAYKEKLKKAKEKEQQKAQKDKQKEIDEARTAAKAEAEEKYKARLEKAEQAKLEAVEKAEKLANRLDKNADKDLVTASLYFGEAQAQLDKFETAAKKITDADAEKGAKLKKVACDFLSKYIDRMN